MKTLKIPPLTLKKKAQEDTLALLRRAETKPDEILTEQEVARLPRPVQRFLHYSGAVGKPKVQTVRLKQRGYFRRGGDQPWMTMEAEEYYTVNPPGFVWFARMRLSRLVLFHALDKYDCDGGKLIGRIYGLVPMVKGEGPEFDQGELLRFLQETAFFPGGFLSEYIKWEEIDDLSARATLTYNGQSVSGVFHFNERGENTDFVAQRYRLVGKKTQLDTWSTPCTGYKEFNGLYLPYKGEAVWKLPEEDLVYGKVEVTEIEYNTPALYGG